ncbi:beta-N-acetylhexosaminidase [Chloroflexota bacterium]
MHSFIGLAPPPEILAGVKSGDISSFCLFAANNVASPAQLRALTDALRQAAAEGDQRQPIIGIDQEGGQLQAITEGCTELPGNMALGATRSPQLARLAGEVLGRELLAMGINLNFAPVLDVNVNPDNPAVGTRSFGDDPALVAELGVALITGLQSAGVLATIKHFPGQGETTTDTHHALPKIKRSLAEMRAVELLPFQQAVQAGVDAVMSTHTIFVALDDHNPATLSPAVMTGLLRDQMAFEGLVITDAMDMYAVAQFGVVESITAALAAGVDLVLLGHLPEQLQLNARLKHHVQSQPIARIMAAQSKLPTELLSLDVVGCTQHQTIAQEIADCSITVVRDNAGRLPLLLAPDDTIAVITVQPENLTPADTSAAVNIGLAEGVRARHARTLALEIPRHASTEMLKMIVAVVAEAKVVVVGTLAADHDPAQAALVQALVEQRQSPVVVALRTPYDLLAFPMIDTYLCAYSIRPVATEAVARVLFGEIEAQGQLPCTIPGLTNSY